jgi:hypothetical protein
MEKFFRDIWVEALAAGVLAAMTALIGKLQEIDPLIIAGVSFLIYLSVFRLIYHLQERKLKKRLNIERERWDKIREKRIKLRLKYSSSTRVPKLLYEMSEKVRELMEKNPIVMTDDNESMTDDLKAIMQLKDVKSFELDTADTKKLLARFPSVKGYKDPIHQMRALVMSVYQVLTAHEVGAKFLVEKEEEYQRLDKEVEELLVGLPQSIHVKKDGYTQLVNAYYSLAAIDFGNTELPQLFRLYQPFMKDVVVTELSTMRAGISSSIERFLTGEDFK